jgi:hypothetical protein
MVEIMNFYKIIEVVVDAILQKKAIEIYYPKTENNEEGWRIIFPQSITTDIPPEGEELVLNEDRLSPGHILNAYGSNTKEKENRSFIIGKIKLVRYPKSN